jgi:hypothetical protein
VRYRILALLLRLGRRVSLGRQRHRGTPWPGRAHAHLAAAILLYELEAAESAIAATWSPACSRQLDRAISALDDLPEDDPRQRLASYAAAYGALVAAREQAPEFEGRCRVATSTAWDALTGAERDTVSNRWDDVINGRA